MCASGDKRTEADSYRGSAALQGLKPLSEEQGRALAALPQRLGETDLTLELEVGDYPKDFLPRDLLSLGQRAGVEVVVERGVVADNLDGLFFQAHAHQVVVRLQQLLRLAAYQHRPPAVQPLAPGYFLPGTRLSTMSPVLTAPCLTSTVWEPRGGASGLRNIVGGV